MCRENEHTHKHHIVPRYMGGTNAKENLVEVSVTQHAMYHFCNYQLWGNEEDRIAWRGLSGIISREQVVYELTLAAQKRAIELARTPDAIEKKKEKLKEIKHQQGEKNSQYGKMWITNGTKKGSYRIGKDEIIPEGYWKGRVCYDNKAHIEKCFAKYTYTIINPSGETISTKNLQRYCDDNGLKQSSMQRVASGKYKHHKGYKVFRTSLDINTNL